MPASTTTLLLTRPAELDSLAERFISQTNNEDAGSEGTGGHAYRWARESGAGRTTARQETRTPKSGERREQIPAVGKGTEILNVSGG